MIAWAVYVKDRDEMLEDEFGGMAVYSNEEGALDAIGCPSPNQEAMYTICKVKIERLA